MDNSTIQYTNSDDFADGTCRQNTSGHVMSYYDLEECFGKPAFVGIGDKTTTEWTIKYNKVCHEWDEETSGVFTIYDWGQVRNHADGGVETSWNIGGRDMGDYFAFLEALEIYKKNGYNTVIGEPIEYEVVTSD